MTYSDGLKILKAASIINAENDSLKDLSKISVSGYSDYLRMISNPYLFKVKNVAVKVSFSGGESAQKILEKIALKKLL